MAVTLSDIAADTGLGIPTVSQILNDTPGRQYRQTTRQRVMAAARKLGYRANAAARTTRTGRFGQIALLNSTDSRYSHQPPTLLDAIHDALAEHDLNTVYVKLPDEKLVSENYTPRILRELMADGLLVNYRYHIPQKMIELIESHRLPAVWLGATHEHDCVCPDNRNASRQITEHLMSLGHRRIAYVDFDFGEQFTDEARPTVRERREGYLQAMTAAGLTPVLICGDHAHGQATTILQQAFNGPDSPQAVVCMDSGNAYDVLAVLTGSLGMSVPDDVSIVTICSSPARIGRIPLTMMLTDNVQLGRQSVQMLLDKIESPGLMCPSVQSPHLFVQGRTVGAPRSRHSSDR